MRWIHVGTVLILITAAFKCLAAAPATQPATMPVYEPPPGQIAEQLIRDGKPVEGFKLLLTISGGEAKALKMAAADPATFGPLVNSSLAKATDPAMLARLHLLRADAEFRAGQTPAALETLRQAAKEMAKSDVYLVDAVSHYIQTDGPFGAGCGSQGDNALIKRFIALGSDADVGDEFARVMGVYQKPRPATAPVYWIASPNDGNRHQFVIDYAYFLKQQHHPDAALKLLGDEVARNDLDHQTGAGWAFGAFGPPADWQMGCDEFLKLAYGEYQTANRADDLIAMIQKQIDTGHNSARRTLARVRLLQSKTDEAFDLEMAYIEHGNFNALSTLCRRAELEEAFSKPALAMADYEKALSLPFEKLDVPGGMMPGCLPQIEPWSATQPTGMEANGLPIYSPDRQARSLHVQIIHLLVPLYISAGQTDKALTDLLAAYDLIDPAVWEIDQPLPETQKRFIAAGQDKQFVEWARAKAPKMTDPNIKAKLCWMAGDNDAAADAVVELFTKLPPAERATYPFIYWKEEFANAGLAEMLAKKLATVGADLDSQVTLLLSDSKAGDAQWIPMLEKIIAKLKEPRPEYTDSGLECLPVNRGGIHHPYFRGDCDVAYQLMRRYERTGQIAKLLALGCDVAHAAKPFDSYAREDSLNGYGKDDATAAICLAISHADDAASQNALIAALKDSPWKGQIAQLQRRQAKTWPPAPVEAFSWANLPQGVNALVSNHDVLSIAADGQRIVVGHPWGLAVYSIDGKPVKRVMLDQPVSALACAAGVIWAGSQHGVYRVDPADWAVKSLPINESIYFLHLLPVNDQLFVLTAQWSAIIDPAKGQMQRFSGEMMFGKSHMEAASAPPLVNGSDIYFLNCRYNLDRKVWQHGTATAIAVADGVIWGVQRVHPDEPRDEEIQICTIDPKTLTATAVPLVAGEQFGGSMKLRSASYAGKLEGRAVPNAGYGYVQADATNQLLRPIHIPDDSTSRIPAGLTDQPLPQWCVDNWEVRATLAGGRYALGDGDGYYRYGQDNVRDYAPDIMVPQDYKGDFHGPAIATADGATRCFAAADGITGDCGYAIADDGKYYWVGTERGVSLLDHQFHVLENFTRENGLPGGRITAIQPAGGKIYLASRHDDHGGGLIVFDPATRLFSLLLASDGLASGAVQDLKMQDGKLSIGYGFEYNRGNNDNRTIQHPPTLLDPATGTLLPSSKPDRDAAGGFAGGSSAMPLLGGETFSQQIIGNKAWITGTRGVIVTDPGTELVPAAIPEWSVKVLSAQPTPDLPDTRTARQRLDDPDRRVRYDAALELADHGQPIPAKVLDDLFDHEQDLSLMSSVHSLGNDYMASSRMVDLAVACAMLVDRETILAFMHHPQYPTTWPKDRVTELLAAAVLSKPEVMQVVLQTHGRFSNCPVESCITRICETAGKPLLPQLHKALSSPDRVVRSNAARACGTIGDPSSIPYLDKAWDLESGLSRASIVWAWGMLKDHDAVSKLQAIYIQLGNVGGAQGNGGLAAQNANARIAEQYDAIKNNQAVDPPDEHLLARVDVAEALARIGPQYAPEFFKSVAAGADFQVKATLVDAMQQCTDPADIKAAVDALRILKLDSEGGIARHAVIGLLRFNETAPRDQMLKWLANPNDGQTCTTISMLGNLTADQAVFTKDAVLKIGADPTIDQPTRDACQRIATQFKWR